MRALIPVVLLTAGLFGMAEPVSADTRLDVGLSIADGDVRGYYLGLSSYYGYDEPYLDHMHRHYGLPYPEIPVALYYSQVIGIDPLIIVRLRMGGWGWYDIGRHYHLPPRVYYYPVPARCHGWGPIAPFYRYPERDWGRIRLSDADVVELVNLRYVSHRYGYAPEYVIDRRRAGPDFFHVERQIWHERGPGHGRYDPRWNPVPQHNDWRHDDRHDNWRVNNDRHDWQERNRHGWTGHQPSPGIVPLRPRDEGRGQPSPGAWGHEPRQGERGGDYRRGHEGRGRETAYHGNPSGGGHVGGPSPSTPARVDTGQGTTPWRGDRQPGMQPRNNFQPGDNQRAQPMRGYERRDSGEHRPHVKEP